MEDFTKYNIEYLTNKFPQLKPHIQFTSLLLNFTEGKNADDLTPILRTNTVPEITLPVLDPSLFKTVSLSNTASLFIEVVTYWMEEQNKINPFFAPFNKDFISEESKSEKFILDFLTGSNSGQKCMATNHIIFSLIKISLIPSFTKLFSAIKIPQWHKGCCPICGFPPLFAKQNSPSFSLVCSFCGYNWNHPKETCPSCSNKNHFEEIYERKEINLHACKKCKKFIRIINTNLFPHNTPDALLNTISSPASILAKEKGYME